MFIEHFYIERKDVLSVVLLSNRGVSFAIFDLELNKRERTNLILEVLLVNARLNFCNFPVGHIIYGGW
jgi:hypothetical protein